MNLHPGRIKGFYRLAVLSLFILLFACQLAEPTLSSPTPEAAPTSTTQPAPATAIPSSTVPSPALSATPTSSPQGTTENFTALCSPLEGETLADLGRPDLLKNPFQPPRPGDDGGHFGVDFAYWTRSDGSAMLGLPIYAALDGVVASVIENRQPYGNALIIETPLQQINLRWQSILPIQDYDPTAPLQPATSLTCPPYDFTQDRSVLSLYLLYAHMQQPVQLVSGSQVGCGQAIGQVGTTGNSVNPHLHLETRIGPSGIKFSSLAHYDTSATREEMRNYCLWRLSGAFMPFDPMQLLSLPSSP